MILNKYMRLKDFNCAARARRYRGDGPFKAIWMGFVVVIQSHFNPVRITLVLVPEVGEGQMCIMAKAPGGYIIS